MYPGLVTNTECALYLRDTQLPNRKPPYRLHLLFDSFNNATTSWFTTDSAAS